LEIIDNRKTKRQKGFETLDNHKIRRQRGFETPNSHKTRRWYAFKVVAFAKQKGEENLRDSK
jgi:hypothetical protein